MDGVALKLVPIAIFEDGLPHIAGHFADFADWHEALAEEFGDFDLDEGKTPQTYILYVPARAERTTTRSGRCRTASWYFSIHRFDS